MKNFIVYNKTTGEILRTGSCPSNMVSIQTSKKNENELVMEGIANDRIEKIVNDKVISKSPEEIIAIEEAEKPDPQAKLISDKMRDIVRRMAIEELTAEGKI